MQPREPHERLFLTMRRIRGMSVMLVERWRALPPPPQTSRETGRPCHQLFAMDELCPHCFLVTG